MNIVPKPLLETVYDANPATSIIIYCVSDMKTGQEALFSASVAKSRKRIVRKAMATAIRMTIGRSTRTKSEPEDDGDSDAESSTASAIGLEDEETNPFTFLTATDSAQCAHEKQYSAEEAKLRYPLKLPYDMVYQDDDLNDEKNLERALQLLYAARLGESGLRARLSIHINYDYLQSDLGKDAPLQCGIQRG